MYFKNIFLVVFVIFALFSTALSKPRYHYTSESDEGGDYDNCNGCTIRNNGNGHHNTVIIRHGPKPAAPRCKRMSKFIEKLYNESGHGNAEGNGEGNGGGSYNNQNREPDCPECYATNFGNGNFNNNTINIEKK